ncbi:MAG: SulP family inorganic anion transporter [Magnetococcales bacterium]|nr:SulP family inorganic anion transporter [Magnetococcales bacterium]MBF0116279.1 SulP family inorganic anion transporter [Magnetococcales bacterium]
MAKALPFLPLVHTLRAYRLSWLRGDLVGGMTACVVMIPSVLAYAELVHMPPISGIYAALAASVGYALFASSRHVIAGPDAAIGLLAGTAILPLAAGDPSRIPALAATLAMISAVILIAAARLRVGTIADFLSRPVLTGYLNGASLILVSTQLGKLFAIKTEGEDFFPLLWQIIVRLPETHTPTFLFGISLIMVMVILGRSLPKIPGALVVTVLAIAAGQILGLEKTGVVMVGHVPQGTPGLLIPNFHWSDIPALAPAAVAISFLAFSDGILLAQAFAIKNKYTINPNQELVALGMANGLASLLQGFPVSASQSRTSIVDAANGKSQVAQLIAAAGLLLFLWFMTDLIAVLPKVALGAILIVTGLGMLEMAPLRELYRIDRFEFSVSVAVTTAILVAGVVPGIILGLLISLVGLLVEVSRPGDAVLQRVGPGRKFHDMGSHSKGERVPGLVVYRLYAPLIFANARHVMSRLRALIQAPEVPVRWLVIDAQAITDMDVTAAQQFAELLRECHAANIQVKLADTTLPFRKQLQKMGLDKLLDEQHLFPTVKKAVAAYEVMLNPVQEITVMVQEPDSEPFALCFRRAGSNLTVTCSCPHSQENEESICEHRLQALRGDFSSLNILDDEDHIVIDTLQKLLEDTDVERAMQTLATAEEQIQSAQKEYQQAKEEIIKAVND